MTQPEPVRDLLRGRIDLFSADALIDMLARLGVGVRLVVKSVEVPNLCKGGLELNPGQLALH